MAMGDAFQADTLTPHKGLLSHIPIWNPRSEITLIRSPSRFTAIADSGVTGNF